MSLIPSFEVTPAQTYGSARAMSILATARALNAAAATFAAEHAKFYARGVEIVLEDLNLNPASGLALFVKNTDAADFINPALEDAQAALTELGGDWSIAASGLVHRVPEVPGLPITYNLQSGLFVEVISPPTPPET